MTFDRLISDGNCSERLSLEGEGLLYSKLCTMSANSTGSLMYAMTFFHLDPTL